MIFVLHYILYNLGLSCVIVLMTLFFRTYAPETSLTEIGILFMILPFISTFVRPICCALADRQQAHKQYLMVFLTLTALGYGAICIPTFFLDLIKSNGRLIWYYYVFWIIIGYSSFGVVFCLGDALSVNAALRRGIPWGFYRAWATFAWGLGGWVIGFFNESSPLPIYVPGILSLCGCIMLEVLIIFFWSDDDFDMSASERRGVVAVPVSTTPGLAPPVAGNENFDQEFREQVHSLSETRLKQQAANDSCIRLTDLIEQHQHQTNNNKSNNCFFYPATNELMKNNEAPPESDIRFIKTSSAGGSTSGLSGRLVAAIANMVVEEVGEGLKSSLRLSKGAAAADTTGRANNKRAALADLIGQEALASVIGHNNNKTNTINSNGHSITMISTMTQEQLAHNQTNHHHLKSEPSITSLTESPGPPLATTTSNDQSSNDRAREDSNSNSNCNPKDLDLMGSLGKAAMRNAQLGLLRMNSLSSANGTLALAKDELMRARLVDPSTNDQGDGLMASQDNSSHQNHNEPCYSSTKTPPTNSHNLMSIANQDKQQRPNELINRSDNGYSLTNRRDEMMGAQDEGELIDQKKMAENLQLVMLRIIIKRDPSILKYMLVFILLGILLYVHLTYFFMHAEIMCRKMDYNFSKVASYYLVAQAFNEILCFLVLSEYYITKVGRTASFVTVAAVFLFRYGYYATYFAHYSPYWAIVTEASHGFSYALTYTLINELSRETVNQLDDYLPELIKLGIVDPRLDPIQLKLPLRATMQGIFSGAFDGFGNGIGVVMAGICLDYYPYEVLWSWCSYLCIFIMIFYPMTEWRKLPFMKGR